VLASGQGTHTLPLPNNTLARLVWEIGQKYPSQLFGLGDFLEDLVPTVSWLQDQGLSALALMGATDLARSYAGLSAVAAARLPVTIVLISGTEEGQTWQPVGLNELSVMLTLPSLNIGEAADIAELRQMIKIGLKNDDGPTVIRYSPRDSGQIVVHPNLGPALGIGKSLMLRQGKELALLALGDAVETSLKVVDELHKQGHEAALVDVRWIRPFDEPLLGAVANHFRRIITLEHGSLNGGFGAAVLELFERSSWHDIDLHRIGLDHKTVKDVQWVCDDILRFLQASNQQRGFNLSLPGKFPMMRFLET
jgi:1-deoxy-D-xylulose-5-phosphate synthase